MAGKKEAEVETPIEEPQEPLEETQTKTFTQEDVDAMRTQVEEQIRQEEFAKYQGLQKVISRKDAEIERLGKQPPASSTKAMSSVVDELERLSQTNYDTDPAAQTRIANLKRQLEAEETRAYQETTIRQNRDRISQEIKEAGGDPDDDQFETVWDAFELDTIDGRFTRADRKLQKVLSKIQPAIKVETKVDDVEKIIEAKAQEKLRAEMERRGMLDSDLGGASGSGKGLTKEDVAKMSPDEVNKRQAEIAKIPFG